MVERKSTTCFHDHYLQTHGDIYITTIDDRIDIIRNDGYSTAVQLPKNPVDAHAWWLTFRSCTTGESFANYPTTADAVESLFRSCLTLSLFYYPPGAATIRPQDDTSSIAHQGDASASTLEEVTDVSARKAQQQTSIVDNNSPMVSTD
jgi:hypothetical protein